MTYRKVTTRVQRTGQVAQLARELSQYANIAGLMSISGQETYKKQPMNA